MPGSSSFRDSTQIILPGESLQGFRCDLQSEFRITIREEGDSTRIIGSPSVIKGVTGYLTRRGIELE